MDQLGGIIGQKIQVKVLKALGISTRSLKAGRVNRTYNSRLPASGGQGPYSWFLISGTLPEGLTFDLTSGSISGTPTAVVTANLTFQVSDALGGMSQKSFTLSVK
ncbi:MAG: Ig domain-containing protein [Alphaproteobacteria bacterium]